MLSQFTIPFEAYLISLKIILDDQICQSMNNEQEMIQLIEEITLPCHDLYDYKFI